MDLILPPNYFEILLSRFESDERLGIASGVYLELWNGQWRAIPMPVYPAAGASKVMRRQCFEEIGGYSPNVGWDSIDEIRARARGWNTCHFEDLRFHHLRPEGRGIGMLRNCKKYGIAYYLMGGGPFFLLFKIPYRMFVAKPVIFGGLAMLWAMRVVYSAARSPCHAGRGQLYRSLLHSRLRRWNRKTTPKTIVTPDRTGSYPNKTA